MIERSRETMMSYSHRTLSIQPPKVYERSLKANFYGLGVILFSMDFSVTYCIYIVIYLIALGLRAISINSFLWSMSDPLHKIRGAAASRTRYVSG